MGFAQSLGDGIRGPTGDILGKQVGGNQGGEIVPTGGDIRFPYRRKKIRKKKKHLKHTPEVVRGKKLIKTGPLAGGGGGKTGGPNWVRFGGRLTVRGGGAGIPGFL